MPIKNSHLFEIDRLRAIAIIGLVILHAFTMWAGNWPMAIGVEPNEIWRWVAIIANSMVLPLFTFISGYLWGMQKTKGYIPFKILCRKKFHRLLLPSLVFGTIYYILFIDFTPTVGGFCHTIASIILGVGHLWYLPVLFSCFLISRLVGGGYFYTNSMYRVMLIFILAITGFQIFPFNIGKVIFYLFYFELGAIIFEQAPHIGKKHIVFLTLSWLILLLSGEIFKDSIQQIGDINKFYSIWLSNLIQLTTGTAGTLACYGFVCLHQKLSPIPSKFTVFIASYSMGIYIFHQFILIALVYHTPLPSLVNTQVLPFLLLATALLGSIALSYLMKQNSLISTLIK